MLNALWKRYALALGLAAALVTCLFALSQIAARTADADAAAVSTAMRQLMLSQRIVLAADELANAPEDAAAAARARLTDAVDTFLAAHERLLGDAAGLDRRGELTPELAAIYFAGDVGLDVRARRYAAVARQVAARDGDDARLELERLGRQSLPGQIALAARGFENRAKGRARGFALLIYTAYVAALALLAGQTALIFWPAHRLVQRTLSSLEAQQTKLQRQKTSAARRANELDRIYDLLEQSAQELEIARTAATRASDQKSAFLATMSHEIRTPLNGVVGMAEALQRTELTSGQQQMLNVMIDSGEGLVAIIDDILDLSKVEAGEIKLDIVAFDMVDQVERVVELNRLKAEDKSLALHWNVAPSARRAFLGDAMRIRQVLHNLVANAIKFTHEGYVSISVGAQETDSPDRMDVVIEVTDTGIGISAEQLATIWEPFKQGDQTATRAYGGTGLGLSISRRLAELMGGDVSARSRLGAGSTFTFTAPMTVSACDAVREPANPPETDAEVAPGDAPETLRILVAEDNEKNRLVLEALLGELDAEIAYVVNGAEAVRAWQAHAYHLVLMDIKMPVMDGRAATREIRRLERETGRARTPIVAVTADAMAHHVREHFAAGVDACIAKPIKARELFETIQRCLSATAEDVDAPDAASDAA